MSNILTSGVAKSYIGLEKLCEPYKADNGKTYLVSVHSIMDTNGSRANVEISDKHGNSICKRYGVEVRFYKRLFRK